MAADRCLYADRAAACEGGRQNHGDLVEALEGQIWPGKLDDNRDALDIHERRSRGCDIESSAEEKQVDQSRLAKIDGRRRYGAKVSDSGSSCRPGRNNGMPAGNRRSRRLSGW